MTPPNQPQEQHVTLAMVYDISLQNRAALERIAQALSNLESGRAVNSSRIDGLSKELDSTNEDIDDLRKRSDTWNTLNSLIGGAAAALATLLGLGGGK